jgi:hypothetical protein
MANLSNINGKFVVEQTTGYVGVGTTDPNFLIEAAGANSEIALNSTSASIYRLRSTSSDSFIITKNGVGDRLVIDGSGNSIFEGSVRVANSTQSNYWLYNATKTNGFLLGRSLASNDGQDFFIFDTIANSASMTINSSQNTTFAGTISSNSISAQGMITVTQNDIGTGESVGLRIIRSGGAQVWNITSGQTGVDNTTFNIRNSTNNTNVLGINASNNSATFTGTVTAGNGSQAVNSDAMLTLRASAFSGLDIKSARTSGNIGGIRFYDTASNTVPEAQLNVEVDGSYNFYNGTSGAQSRLKIANNGWVSVVTKPNSGLNYNVAIWVGDVLGYQTTEQLSDVLAYGANKLSPYNGITFADGQEATTSSGTVIPAPGRSTSPDPEDYQRSFSTEFKLKSASGNPGVTGSWAGLISMAPYRPSISGFYATQIAFGGDGTGDGMFTRRGTTTTWGAWREFVIEDTSGNISPSGVYLGGTAAANLLDDYEEGTFQTNINSTNVTNYSYSGQNGRYTKIGRQVIVTFVIDSVTAGTGFKYFVISNLPFAQHTSSHNEQGYCSNYPRGERRSGIIINNSSGESNTWYVGYNNNSSQSGNALRGTIIYTTS